MEIVEINHQNLADINKANQPFVIIGKIKPTFDSGNWSYTEEIYEQPYMKVYPNDFCDYAVYIDNSDKTIFFAYSNAECIGQIILKRDWNRYAFIEDICVAESVRGQGIGTALIVYCADCGRRMYNERTEGKNKKAKNNYICSSYRRHTTQCTMHFIQASVVEELILESLREVSDFTKENREEFRQLVMKNSTVRQEEEVANSRKKQSEQEKRIAELDRLIRRIYEDNVAGKLSDKRFEKLSAEYEREQEELEQSIAELRADVDSYESRNSNVDKFLELLERYADFDTLTTPMLNEFVHKVIVH